MKKWEVCKLFCWNMMKYDGHPKEKHLCDWTVSWATCYFLWNTIFTWKNNRQLNYAYSTWVFGRHSLKNEQSLLFKEKKFILCMANGKIQAFTYKLEFWKNCICHHKLNRFPTLKDFSDMISAAINKCNFLYIV